jgi:membrane-associated phospholipid phosphatase
MASDIAGTLEISFLVDASVAPSDDSASDLVETATAISPSLSLAPGATWNEKPYIPPKWAAGKPNAGTWITTGAIAAGWAYLWIDGDRTDDAETIKEVGDYTQIFTAAAGLGMTIGAKDKQGLIQYGISFGVSMATVQLFKHTADRWRPDGTDTLSFPSGHTAGSFFGAGYI